MRKNRNIQIAAALTIVAMAALVIIVLTVDGSGDTDAVSNDGQGDVPARAWRMATAVDAQRSV